MRLLPVIGVLLGLGWFFSSSAEEVSGGIPPFYTTVQGGEVDRLDVCWPLYSRAYSKQEQTQRLLWFGFERSLPKQERTGRCSSLFCFPASRKRVSYRLSFPYEPCMIF